MIVDLKDKINFFKILNFLFIVMFVISFSFFLALTINSYIFYKFFNLNDRITIVHKTVQKLTKSYNSLDYLFKAPIVPQKIVSNERKFGNKPHIEAAKPVSTSNLNIKLLGTIITKNDKAAFIEKNGKLELVKVNDKIGNLKIKDIKSYSLILTDGVNQYEITLSLKEGKNNFRKRPVKRKVEMASVSNNQSSTDTYKISKREVEKQTADLGKILRYVRIIPVVENGETKGYKLAYVSPRSILYKYGLRSGDFIVSVNGMPVKTAEEAFKLYNILRNESTITLVVERKGEQKTITYEIQ